MYRVILIVLMALTVSPGVVAGFQDQEQTPSQSPAPPKELIQYVRNAKKAGQNDFQIQQNAVNSGWPLPVVNAAILYVRDNDAAAASPATSAVTDNVAKQDTAVQSASASIPATSTPAPREASTRTGTAPPADTAGGRPQVSRGVPDDYHIGTGDILEINVWKEPDASVKAAVVRTDGKISMPLLKDVRVLDFTPVELEKLLTEQLSGLINSPDVTVVVAGTSSKKVYVTGKVKKEGTIPFTYRMTVMQALLEAGGINEYAKKKAIYIMRTENGKQFRFPFDYAAVLKGQHLELNIELQAGDMIVVP